MALLMYEVTAFPKGSKPVTRAIVARDPAKARDILLDYMNYPSGKARKDVETEIKIHE